MIKGFVPVKSILESLDRMLQKELDEYRHDLLEAVEKLNGIDEMFFDFIDMAEKNTKCLKFLKDYVRVNGGLKGGGLKALERFFKENIRSGYDKFGRLGCPELDEICLDLSIS